MSNKIKVNLSDKYRVLLTEVLPYELPLWFTNYNLYKISKLTIGRSVNWEIPEWFG